MEQKYCKINYKLINNNNKVIKKEVGMGKRSSKIEKKGKEYEIKI
jgi:hypothetical protein